MKKMNKKLVMLLVFVIAFALTTSLAFAKKDNDNGSSNKNDNASKVKELKDFEKPTKDKTNAQIHKDKTGEVADELKNVGKGKKMQGDDVEGIPGEATEGVGVEEDADEIAEEAEEIAEEIAEAGEEASEVIEEIEKQNKFKKLLVGTDYENLGQLRSSLAHNENQIRKLTKLSEKVQTQEMAQNMGTDSEIQNQLVILMQERERIKTVLQDGQEGFSILGWFRKLFGIKTDIEVAENNEEQIEEEVLEVLEDEGEDDAEDESGEEGEDGGVEEETETPAE